jgi:hypothetical protein
MTSAANVPKMKKDAPVGFTIHSLKLYAPFSLGAIAAAAFGYECRLDMRKSIPMFMLSPLLMIAALLDWKASSYRKLISENEIDIDAYTDSKPTFLERAKIVTLHGLSTGGHARSLQPHKLAMSDSAFVPGLIQTWRSKPGASEKSLQPLKMGPASQKPILVGTIRMGFGHHRIAYSASSWALGEGCQTVFHDLLAISSPEAKLIHEADKLYSKVRFYRGAHSLFYCYIIFKGITNASHTKTTNIHGTTILNEKPASSKGSSESLLDEGGQHRAPRETRSSMLPPLIEEGRGALCCLPSSAYVLLYLCIIRMCSRTPIDPIITMLENTFIYKCRHVCMRTCIHVCIHVCMNVFIS